MSNESFVEWAMDPGRTLEEAFCAELMIEWGVKQWNSAHKIHNNDLYERIEKFKRRGLNPAHRPSYTREDAEHAAEMLPKISYISLGNHGDRLLRDLSALRFATRTTNLSISNAECSDLRPLQALTSLDTLSIIDKELEDYAPLGGLTGLRMLTIYSGAHWPRFEGLENLRKLEWLNLHASLLALEGIPAIHASRKMTLDGASHGTPLRNLTRLPLTTAHDIELSGMCSLDGIERWPHVRSLKLTGLFKSLAPLGSAGLNQLTYLALTGEHFIDLTPLSFLPELRVLELNTQQPLDLYALTDAPKLREIRTGRSHIKCTINEREAATFNASRESWDAEFLAPEPRALPPQELFVYSNDAPNHNHLGNASDTLPPLLDNHAELLETEGGWFGNRLAEALNRFYGHDNWGIVNKLFHGRTPWVQIHTLEAAERIWQAAQVIRNVMASSRIQHVVTLRIELLLRFERQTADWRRDRNPDEFNAREAREEHEEWVARRKNHERFLEQLHRLRLAEAEGAKINPEDFAVEPAEPEPVFEPESDSDVLDARDEEENEPDPHPLAENYDSFLTVREDGLWVAERCCPAIQLLACRRAIPRDPPPPPGNKPPPDEPPPMQPGPPSVVPTPV